MGPLGGIRPQKVGGLFEWRGWRRVEPRTAHQPRASGLLLVLETLRVLSPAGCLPSPSPLLASPFIDQERGFNKFLLVTGVAPGQDVWKGRRILSLGPVPPPPGRHSFPLWVNVVGNLK